MIIDFPFLLPGIHDLEAELYRNAESAGHGGFPVGSNGFWHGGTHLTVPNHPVRAIADGVVVAYRLNDKPVDYEGPLPANADGSQSKATYSNAFVLIRHDLTSPAGSTFTYYSLYAHLQPLTKEETEAHATPGQQASIFQKTEWVVADDTDGGGMPVVDKGVLTSKGIVPFGSTFNVSPNDDMCNNHRYRKIRRLDDIIEGYVAVAPETLKRALPNIPATKGMAAWTKATILNGKDVPIVDGKGTHEAKLLPRGAFFTEEGASTLRYEKVEYLEKSGYALIEPSAHVAQRSVPSAGTIPVVDDSGADRFSIPAGKTYRVLGERPPATSAIAKQRIIKVHYPDPKGAKKLDGYAFLRLGYDTEQLPQTTRDDGNLCLWGHSDMKAIWANEIADDNQKSIGEIRVSVFELLPDAQVPADHWTRSVGWRKVVWDAEAKQGQTAVHVDGYSFFGPHVQKVESPPGGPEKYQVLQASAFRKLKTDKKKIVLPPKNASVHYTSEHGIADRLSVEKMTSVESRPWDGRFNGVSVRASASDTAPVVGILGLGTVARFKEEIPFKVEQQGATYSYSPTEKKYHELSDGGFVYLAPGKLRKQAEFPKPIHFNSVVYLDPPAPVRRGDIIGWPGPYVSLPRLIHFEVFSKDHTFVSNAAGNRWGEKLVLVDPKAKLRTREAVPPEAALELPPRASVKIEQRSRSSIVKATYCKAPVLSVDGWIEAAKLEKLAPPTNQRKLRTDVSALYDEVKETHSKSGSVFKIDTHKASHPIPGKQGDIVTLLDDKGDVCKVKYDKNADVAGWVAESDLLRSCEKPHLDPLIGTKWYTLKKALTLWKQDPATDNRFQEPTEPSRKDALRKGLERLVQIQKCGTTYAAKSAADCVDAQDRAGKVWRGIPLATGEWGWLPVADAPYASFGYDWLGWQIFDEETAPAAGGRFSDDGFCDIDVVLQLVREAESNSEPAHKRLRRLVCRHPSEWDASAQEPSKKYERLKEKMSQADFDKLMSHVRKMHFWGELTELPGDAKVWHYHPLGFVSQLKKMGWIFRDELLQIFHEDAEEEIDKYLPYLNDALEKYEINTPDRIAHFLAQVALESGEFRFTEEVGADKVGANYEGGKGNPLKGDGRRFIGRGFIQVTGRTNYEQYEASLGEDLTSSLENAEKLKKEPRLVCDSAGWFWRTCATRKIDLNALADNAVGQPDFKVVESITTKVNGGFNHLGKRVSYFLRAKLALARRE